MDDVKRQVHKLKQENHGLESELRSKSLYCWITPAASDNGEHSTIANSSAEQRVRLLEARVSENMETIEQLRQERSLLSTDHKDLQRRFVEISEVSEL